MHDALGGSDKFGLTTKAINGKLECNGQNLNQSKQRFRYYTKVFSAFKLNGKPVESGYY